MVDHQNQKEKNLFNISCQDACHNLSRERLKSFYFTIHLLTGGGSVSFCDIKFEIFKELRPAGEIHWKGFEPLSKRRDPAV